jgi:tetratricopeptide (TPR) repeat protein
MFKGALFVVFAFATVLYCQLHSLGAESSGGTSWNEALQQGKYVEAEHACQRSIRALDEAPRSEDAVLASSLNNLADLYLETGRGAQAEPLLQRSLDIRLRLLGPGHPDVGMTMNNLGALYKRQHKLSQARPEFERALAVLEKSLGPNDLRVAEVLSNLASLSQEAGRYVDALAFSARAGSIVEKAPNPQPVPLAGVPLKHSVVPSGYHGLLAFGMRGHPEQPAVAVGFDGPIFHDHVAWIPDVLLGHLGIERLKAGVWTVPSYAFRVCWYE